MKDLEPLIEHYRQIGLWYPGTPYNHDERHLARETITALHELSFLRENKNSQLTFKEWLIETTIPNPEGR